MILFNRDFILLLAVAVGFTIWCINFIISRFVARAFACGLVALLAIVALIILVFHI